MSGKKITLALLCFIVLAILYQQDNGSTTESNKASSIYSKIKTEKNDALLPTIPLSAKPHVTQSGVKKDEGIDIFECFPDISLDEEARVKSINQYFKSLDDSMIETEALYYALYAKPEKGETRLDLLFEYADKFSMNSIVAMDLISLCSNSSDSRCTTNLVNNAIALDNNNGAIWISVVSFYAEKGDDEGVINSIYALEQTSFFNERIGEKALLYAQALEGSASNNFNANAIAGIGNAASSFLAYSPITRWCEQGLDKLAKADACLTLGKELTTRSKTLISQMIGIALQSMVLELQGNTEVIKIVEKNRQKLAGRSGNEQYKKASVMMLLDERLLRSWLINVDLYGEFESQRLLLEEAVFLYEENENYLCTLIYEVLDGF